MKNAPLSDWNCGLLVAGQQQAACHLLGGGILQKNPF